MDDNLTHCPWHPETLLEDIPVYESESYDGTRRTRRSQRACPRCGPTY